MPCCRSPRRRITSTRRARPIRGAAGAGPSRRRVVHIDPAGLGGELPRLRRAQGLAAAASGRSPGGALHGRAADGPAGPAGRRPRPALQDDDPGGPRRATRRSCAAAVHGVAARSAVGRGSDLRGDLAGFVYVAFVIDGSRVGSSAGGSRARCTAISRSMRSSRPSTPARRAAGLIHHSDRGCQYLSIRYTERLTEAGIEAFGRQRRRLLRQRARRVDHRPVQDRGHSRARTLAHPRRRRVRDVGVGRLVQ